MFLPEESHGQRSLVGYGSQGHKELDMTNMYLSLPNARKSDWTPYLLRTKYPPLPMKLKLKDLLHGAIRYK